jgi:hypothetical protein
MTTLLHLQVAFNQNVLERGAMNFDKAQLWAVPG